MLRYPDVRDQCSLDCAGLRKKRGETDTPPAINTAPPRGRLHAWRNLSIGSRTRDRWVPAAMRDRIGIVEGRRACSANRAQLLKRRPCSKSRILDSSRSAGPQKRISVVR